MRLAWCSSFSHAQCYFLKWTAWSLGHLDLSWNSSFRSASRWYLLSSGGVLDWRKVIFPCEECCPSEAFQVYLISSAHTNIVPSGSQWRCLFPLIRCLSIYLSPWKSGNITVFPENFSSTRVHIWSVSLHNLFWHLSGIFFGLQEESVNEYEPSLLAGWPLVQIEHMPLQPAPRPYCKANLLKTIKNRPTLLKADSHLT